MMFPYTGEIDQTGSGKGDGYTVNIPVVREFTDDDMIYLYHEILRPVIYGYRPQLIMVAAGFDAHTDDPIGRSRLTEATYGGVTRLLRHLKSSPENPPLFYALEGGYHQRALAESIKAILTELINSLSPMPTLSPCQAVIDLVEQVKKIHLPFGVIHND
jgi:acetoin utilization deacetylase AcuC-like enzyme